MTLDFTARVYKTSEAAMISGITPTALRTYFFTGAFRLVGRMKDGRAEAHGQANRYCLREVLGFAVAKSLIDMGANAADAFDAAMRRFALTGDERRNPGDTFNINEHGETLMLFSPATGAARLLPADEFNLREALDGEAGIFVLNVSAVVDAALARLVRSGIGDV